VACQELLISKQLPLFFYVTMILHHISDIKIKTLIILTSSYNIFQQKNKFTNKILKVSDGRKKVEEKEWLIKIVFGEKNETFENNLQLSGYECR
jgi:hypothetical protein